MPPSGRALSVFSTLSPSLASRVEGPPLHRGWWRSKLAGSWVSESPCERKPPTDQDQLDKEEIKFLCVRPLAFLECSLTALVNPYVELLHFGCPTS